MRHVALLFALPMVAFSFAAVACGGDDDEAAPSPFQDQAPTEPAPAPPPVPSFGKAPDGGAREADAGPGKVLFYAHSDTTLYALDPEDLGRAPEPVGAFDCVGAGLGTTVMTDLAVDKLGRLFGVSPNAAWPITLPGAEAQPHCEAKWPLPADTHFNGMTMAPERTIAEEEVLVGGNALGELFRIDPETGATTVVGTLGTDAQTGRPWTVSGDMVFMENGGAPIGFVTARTCTTTTRCDSNDTLLEVDVKAIGPGRQSVLKAVRGPIVKGAWCTNAESPPSFGSIFGIVAYQDRVYGFSRRGDIIEIRNDDGSACLVRSEPSVRWAGAGITTVAPVKAPPSGPR